MKNIKIIIFGIIVILLSQFSSFSQVKIPLRKYEKMEFHNFTPAWYETCYDSTLRDGVVVDGYNQFHPMADLDPLVYENKIYSAYNGLVSGGGGTYIQCRSLKTGELLWQDRYLYEDIDRQEIARLFRINIDGQLEVFGMKRIHPKAQNDGSYFTDYILTRRVYDKENGKLLSYFHRDLEDPDAHQMIQGINQWRDFSYMFYRDDHILVIDHPRRPNSIMYRSSKIDFTGKLLAIPDTLYVPYITRFYNVTQISKDTFLTIGYDYKNNKLYFRYLSPELRILKDAIYKTTEEGFWQFELLDITVDKSKLLLSNQLNLTGPIPWPYMELYVFDRNANILKKAILPEKITELAVLDWKSSDNYFIYSHQKNNATPNNRFYSSTDIVRVTDSKSQILKEIVATDSLRFPIITDFIEIDESNLLLTVLEGSFAKTSALYTQDVNAKAFSTMFVSKTSLDLLTNIDEVKNVDAGVVVYPNPTQDNIEIRFDKPFTGALNILDINGKVLEKKKFVSQNEITIDLTSFKSGLYIVRLSYGDQLVTYKVVKI